MGRYALIVIACLILCAQSVLCAPPEGEGWELAKHDDGIEVYTRPVEGLDAKEFMGIGKVEAPLRVIMEVFHDIPSYPQWYGFCRDIRLIEEYDRYHQLVYFVLATMWPTKDRDMVIEAVTEVDYDKGTARISLNALKDPVVPPDDRYVRMTHMIGKAFLTEEDDEVLVVYTCQSDPAGKVPAKIANMIAVNQPYDTIKGLRKMADEDRYYEMAGVEKD